MIKFSTKTVRSFTDLEGHISLNFYAVGCNLRCHGCFYLDSFVTGNTPTMGEESVLSLLERNRDLIDAVIFSGGEFLLYPLEDLRSFLRAVRAVFSGIIIVNTNGTFPEKMKRLHGEDLVDGFHTDLKFPVGYQKNDLYVVYYKDIFKIEFQEFHKILASLDLTVRLDNGYNQIRSVKYPFIMEKDWQENFGYIDELNKTYGKNTPYHLNDYVVEKEDN